MGSPKGWACFWTWLKEVVFGVHPGNPVDPQWGYGDGRTEKLREQLTALCNSAPWGPREERERIALYYCPNVMPNRQDQLLVLLADFVLGVSDKPSTDWYQAELDWHRPKKTVFFHLINNTWVPLAALGLSELCKMPRADAGRETEGRLQRVEQARSWEKLLRSAWGSPSLALLRGLATKEEGHLAYLLGALPLLVSRGVGFSIAVTFLAPILIWSLVHSADLRPLCNFVSSNVMISPFPVRFQLG